MVNVFGGWYHSQSQNEIGRGSIERWKTGGLGSIVDSTKVARGESVWPVLEWARGACLHGHWRSDWGGNPTMRELGVEMPTLQDLLGEENPTS